MRTILSQYPDKTGGVVYFWYQINQNPTKMTDRQAQIVLKVEKWLVRISIRKHMPLQ
jgi:hypothetical protein